MTWRRKLWPISMRCKRPVNTPLPKIACFLYGPDRPLTATGPLGQKPLPLSRNATLHNPNRGATHPLMGDYFEAVTQLVILDYGGPLVQAVTAQTGQPCRPDEIEAISITLEKHGAFYHPALVRVTTPVGTTPFVANVAVSDPGRRMIKREFQLLRHLDPSTTGPKRRIPASYYQHTWDVRGWPLYLGQWFEGFHEFHLTIPRDDDPDPIVVWATEPYHLTGPSHKAALCHQIARLLTQFYNPLTFEQIVPWHHAAGDFIIRVGPDAIEAKLITVRDYRPLAVAPEETTPASILEGLLFFFLHLSLQMRLDRLDGTGELVWAGEWAVNGAVNGFFEALLEKPDPALLSLPLSTAWGFYMARQTTEQLQRALGTVTSMYLSTSPEHHLIHQHFSSHLDTLQNVLAPITALFQPHLD